MSSSNLINGRYLRLEVIGEGGMGTVYMGQNVETEEYVAIKEIRRDLVRSDPEILRRFEREGEALRELDHPNIVKMLDTVRNGDEHYIIMEYVGGGSLEKVVKKAELLPMERVLRIALDICDALTRAHRLKIVHRDLKPANILLSETGAPKLTDFGAARFVTRETVTETGAAVGTLDYMPPEAFDELHVDERADIWSLGVTIFEMLCGERPFEGPTVLTLLNNIVTRPPKDIQTLRPDIPIRFAILIYRMLAKNPSDRAESIRFVGAELEAVLRGLTEGTTDAISADEVDSSKALTSRFIRTNLTQAATVALPGYEAELHELETMLVSPSTRLITVMNIQGVDKNDLLLTAARSQMGLFKDGVFEVEMKADMSNDGLLQAIADVLEVKIEGEDKRKPLLEYLKSREILLLLKDFDPTAELIEVIRDLHEQAPKLNLALTSGKALETAEETLFDIQRIEIKHIENLLKQGVSDFRRGRMLLSDYVYRKVMEFSEQGLLTIDDAAKPLMEATRTQFFRRQLISRVFTVLLVSSLTFFVGLPWGFVILSEIPPIFFALLMTFFIMFQNALCATLVTTFDYWNYSNVRKLWMVPLVMGLGLGSVTAVLQPTGQLWFTSIFEAFEAGLILGVLLGFAIYLSIPTKRPRTWWERLRRSFVVGPLTGLIVSIISIASAEVPVTAVSFTTALVVWLEYPLIFLFGAAILNIGIEVSDRGLG